MTEKLKVTIGYGFCSFALCFFTPWGVAAFVVSIFLFAFILWSERLTKDESSEIKQKLKELESRVNNLALGKSLGR